MKQPPKKENLAIWYSMVNGTNEYCNKKFHLAYSILKTDIARKTKKVIGILYNESDPIKPNLLYFQVILNLSESFNLDLLLRKVIYKVYNKQMIKRHLLEDENTKKIIDQCLYILKKNSNYNEL